MTTAGEAGDCVSIFGKEPLEPDFLWARQTNTEGDSPDKTNSPLHRSRESLYLFLLAEGTSCIIMLLCSATVRVVACLATSSSPPFFVISFIFSLERDHKLCKLKRKKRNITGFFSFSFRVFRSSVSSPWMRTSRRDSNACFSHFTILSFPDWFFILWTCTILIWAFFFFKPIRYHNVYINHIRM